MAMIGGGPGAFIGPVHRIAAELDREIELVAGVFSSDAGRSKAAADIYRIDPARAYGSLDEMLAAEKARDDGADFVSVVTPNHNHLPSVRAAMEAGFPPMCDKPVTASLAEARELEQMAIAHNVVSCLDFEFRFVPAWQRFAELLQDGAKTILKSYRYLLIPR